MRFFKSSLRVSFFKLSLIVVFVSFLFLSLNSQTKIAKAIITATTCSVQDENMQISQPDLLQLIEIEILDLIDDDVLGSVIKALPLAIFSIFLFLFSQTIIKLFTIRKQASSIGLIHSTQSYLQVFKI